MRLEGQVLDPRARLVGVRELEERLAQQRDRGGERTPLRVVEGRGAIERVLAREREPSDQLGADAQ